MRRLQGAHSLAHSRLVREVDAPVLDTVAGAGADDAAEERVVTSRVRTRLFFMYKAELLEKISEEHSIVAETHVWQVKQTYKRVVMFCHVMRVVKVRWA